ncbi:hypothetical protein M758_7G065700 [Ceratodon purpureus]|nr:hypothetical protein M758_7G065700 [Ceratodon purpureus]
MRTSTIRALAPLVLLSAAFGSWSLISVCFLFTFFIVQYQTPRQVQQPRAGLWIPVIVLSGLVVLAEASVVISWFLLGENGLVLENEWFKLLGLTRLNPWGKSAGDFLFLLPQVAAFIVAAYVFYREKHDSHDRAHELLWDEDVYEFRAMLRSFVLPLVLLLVGIARPSWITLPYFVCSCASLFHWAMTNNFVGLSWGWRPLIFYTGLHISALYLDQLPLSLPESIADAADYLGLFKLSNLQLGWPEGCQVASLISLYILLCYGVSDMEDEQKDSRTSESSSNSFGSNGQLYNGDITEHDSLNESLLPSHLPTVLEDPMMSRRWAANQRRVITFQRATITLFTYGFPICMMALICWSFTYASLCAFGLLLYVGYIFFALPSVNVLRRLNPVILGFILMWALSTYLFNAAFTIMKSEFDMDLDIWHTIGLWHYSTPGLFIFAQYVLGVLVATEIFASNSIVNNLSEDGHNEEASGNSEQEREDTKVLALAVIAWCLRESADIISLLLIFAVGMKDGLIHAIYMCFFMVQLVRSSIGRRTRQYLILLCEVHIAVLYLLQLDWISAEIKSKEATLRPTLSFLGIWAKADFEDFLAIGALLLFSAMQNHGLNVLSFLSTTVQRSPHAPLGWSVLHRKNGRAILLSVYTNDNIENLQQENSTEVNWITKRLAAFTERLRYVYRMFGTYIAYTTILCLIYGVGQSYVSFGYLFFLLCWVIGRQIVGKSEQQLWLPLMIFAGVVFIVRYILCAFPDTQDYVDDYISLAQGLGFHSDMSIFENLWDCLTILIVMQLFRYERAHKECSLEDPEQAGDHINLTFGLIALMKRFLILHSGKVLFMAVFYVAITPVSAFGFLYLVMLVFTCNMSKTSRLPGQIIAQYTAVLMVVEYLFQLWGEKEDMVLGQVHGEFTFWLGLRSYGSGFWATEAGMRSKAVVLASCILQSTTLGWLELLPASLRVDEQYEEPCLLFLPYPRRNRNSFRSPQEPPSPATPIPQDSLSNDKSFPQTTPSTSARNSSISTAESSTGSGRFVSQTPTRGSANEDSSRNLWGIGTDSRQWSKRAMLLQKHDRYEAQIRTMNIYIKHIIEHFCQLYGLELSMIALLVSSFALLNVVSLVYVFILALCILLNKRTLKTLWPVFVVLFGLILVAEYAVLCKAPPLWSTPDPMFGGTPSARCADCLQSYTGHFSYCWKCWLGLALDDAQMLVANFVVFLVACFQLRANMSAGDLGTRSFYAAIIPASDRLAWKEISYETTSQWTWLDHLRFFFYHNLLLVVLILVFITGTLQYDVLHLGYLAFALVFFRMWDTMMIRRNSIFWILRLYNFILIVASLAYQAPYFSYLGGQACSLPLGLYNIVGLYKYDYGFRITERSAVVDITIFCLVGLQSHIFRSREFEQVLRYMEAQQVEARARAQEDKAAWKKEQLQRIRAMEEHKQRRRKQVEKMKFDMLHMQLHPEVPEVEPQSVELDNFGSPMHPMPSPFNADKSRFNTPRSIERIASEFADARRPEPRLKRGLDYDSKSPTRTQEGGHTIQSDTSDASDEDHAGIGLGNSFMRRRQKSVAGMDRHERPAEARDEVKLKHSITDSVLINQTLSGMDVSNIQLPTARSLESDRRLDRNWKGPIPGLMSGVQILEEGVAEVHSIGNKALANLVGLLSIDKEDENLKAWSGEEEILRNSKMQEALGSAPLEPRLGEGKYRSGWWETWTQLCMLSYYSYCQIRGNTDIVCYFFFILAYVWNFSLLTLLFPATLFLYALLVNPGPSQYFWLAMLIYTEVNILLQYCYQIRATHCDPVTSPPSWLRKLGIPGSQGHHSFVVSVLPLFLVYLVTLMQSSIKAQDGEWMFVNERSTFFSNRRLRDPEGQTQLPHKVTVLDTMWKAVCGIPDLFWRLVRGLSMYWQALTSGSEAPPHFVQVSMAVDKWPEAGIQPERIESACNRLLVAVRSLPLDDEVPPDELTCSRVRVESIENSPDKPNTALAVLEVIHAAAPLRSAKNAQYSSLTPAADVAAELLKAKERGCVEAASFPYPILSVIPGGKREVDLYAFIFGTDLIAFLFVLVFYQSFVRHSPKLLDVTRVEDQFPKDFIFVLMTLFFMIVADRVLYLCSFATGKMFSYFFSLVLYTTYASKVVWEIEATVEPESFILLRAFYLMKGLSLALQAMQIKYGLPHKSALYGQFLARRVNTLSWCGYRVYRALPFLFELRCVLDWSCTTTALTMYDWLKLEDIYGSLFLVQCDVKLVRARHRLGQKQGMWIKFCSGILLFCVLIGVIWAPMLIYSSGNPTNMANPVNDVRAGIEVKTVGGKFPLYETGLCHIYNLESPPEDSLSTLAAYDIRDVQIICCEHDAATLWQIPPSTLQSLIQSIHDGDLTFYAWWEFTRERPKGKELASWSEDVTTIENNLFGVGSQLRAVLNGTLASVNIAELYPLFFRVPGSGEVRPLETGSARVSGNLTLNKEQGQAWWSFLRDSPSEGDGCGRKMGPIAYVVSEEVPPKGLLGETLSKFSIWSLYITFVLAVGRFIRLQCSDIRMRIPYENFPACDRLVAICEDIYAARAEGELELEEGLFWTIVKIYRAPYMLMEYTKVE